MGRYVYGGGGGRAWAAERPLGWAEVDDDSPCVVVQIDRGRGSSCVRFACPRRKLEPSVVICAGAWVTGALDW